MLGFKGYSVFANYTFAKNIVGQVEYYDLKDKVTDLKAKNFVEPGCIHFLILVISKVVVATIKQDSNLLSCFYFLSGALKKIYYRYCIYNFICARI